MLIVNVQSVKNSDTAGLKGYDAGKKVSGIKRHIAVDSNGLPHGIRVTTANVSDRSGALELFSQVRADLKKLQNFLSDGAYTGAHFSKALNEILGTHCEVTTAKRSELHRFAVIPKRWIVERSFA